MWFFTITWQHNPSKLGRIYRPSLLMCCIRMSAGCYKHPETEGTLALELQSTIWKGQYALNRKDWMYLVVQFLKSVWQQRIKQHPSCTHYASLIGINTGKILLGLLCSSFKCVVTNSTCTLYFPKTSWNLQVPDFFSTFNTPEKIVGIRRNLNFNE